MIRHFIRHGDVMQNDSLNAVCSVVWNVIRVLWDSAMCNIPECGDVCMAWCEVECGRDVEWCAEMWWSDLAGANYSVM